MITNPIITPLHARESTKPVTDLAQNEKHLHC